MSDDRQEFTHPAYGIITLSNPRGGGMALFGSSMLHHSVMEIGIHTADYIRDLHHDWYHPRKNIISIRLSESQFARFICSTGSGSGTPCTIIDRDGKYVGKLEDEHVPNLRHTFNSEVKDRFQTVTNNIKEAINLLKEHANKDRVNKTERKEVLTKVDRILSDVESNIPWMIRVFNEALDKVSDEVKAEIESFFNNLISRNQDLLSTETMPEIRKLLDG